MSSTVFTDKVTMVPAAWANDVNTLTYSIFGGAQNTAQALAALGLTNIAGFDPNAVTITGGSIDGVSIGQNVAVSAFRATVGQITAAPVNANDIVNLSFLNAYTGNAITTAINQLTATLGTMAYQNVNNVRITGGSIDNVAIGSTGPVTGIFSSAQVSNPPALSNDVVTLGFMTAHYDAVLANFGGMATQNPNAVSITGGVMDGVIIGSTTPAQGTFSNLSVTMSPVAPNQVTTKAYVDAQIAASAGTLGTMATQNANNVAITGGNINGTTIGAGTPGPATFVSSKVIGTQAVYTATFNQGQASNYGGLTVTEGNTTLLHLWANGENNSTSSNIGSLWSANPLYVTIGNYDLMSFTVANTTLLNQTKIAYGAASSYGPNQNMSLIAGDTTQFSGGVKLLGGNATNYGYLAYQQSNLSLELAADSASVLSLNVSTNASINACFGAGEVVIGASGVPTASTDVNKLQIRGGVYSQQGMVAPHFRRQVTALGTISGSVALNTNTYSAVTMTLSANTTQALDGVDSRYTGTAYYKEMSIMIQAANGIVWTLTPASGGTINGSASWSKTFSDSSVHWFKMASWNNGLSWSITQLL